MAKQLLDQYGNPIDTSRLAREESAPTITGVRQILSDHPAQGLTPVKLARILLEAEQGDATSYLELAEEMEEKDLHYGSVLRTRKLQVSQLPITVEAASDEAVDQKAADLVRELLVDTDVVSDYLFDQMDAVGKGYSVGEIIWQTGASRWAPSRIEWRDPRWFEFDRADGRTLLLRGGPSSDAGYAGGGIGTAAPLKPYGYVVHYHRTKSGLPIRGGLARAVAWLYLFKNYDIKAWVEFLEVFGQPIRVGKYKAGATPEEKATLLRAVRNIAKDAAAIIPDSMLVELIEAKVTGNVTVQQGFADWCDKQVSKAVLGQTGTTDNGQYSGTANVHDGVKDDIERDDARQLRGTIADSLVRPTVDLNLGPQPRYPRLKIERPDSEDVTALMVNVKTFVELGGRVEASVIRDRLGLPDPPPGDKVEVLRVGPAPAATPEAGPTKTPPADLATASQLQIRSEDALDDLVAEGLKDWQPLMDPVIAPIQQLLAECNSTEEFERRLPEALATMNTDAITEQLARALFAARAAGETEAEIG